MIPIPADPFDEFMRLPTTRESADPRFDVWRATEQDYERVFDCVDESFGRRRPRAVYDWLYRRNPYGRARVWVVSERATGRLLKTGAYFPWPVWRGDQPLPGSLCGDVATVPDWQRRGLSKIRREVRRSHPWHGSICTIAGPNEGSRVVTTKAGEAESILGALPGGVAVLRPKPVLERFGIPRPLIPLGSGAISGLASAVRAVALRPRAARAKATDNAAALRVEPCPRFEDAIDDVTERTMAFPAYWCPHPAAFLNWRYLDHPVESYSAFVLLEGESPIGYSVLRIAGEDATLSELAVASSPRTHGALLLHRTLEIAREAGCATVRFFAPPVWRHWGLLRRAGFIPYRTKNYLDVSYQADKEGALDLRRWQLTPGDRDYH